MNGRGDFLEPTSKAVQGSSLKNVFYPCTFELWTCSTDVLSVDGLGLSQLPTCSCYLLTRKGLPCIYACLLPASAMSNFPARWTLSQHLHTLVWRPYALSSTRNRYTFCANPPGLQHLSLQSTSYSRLGPVIVYSSNRAPLYSFNPWPLVNRSSLDATVSTCGLQPSFSRPLPALL